MTSSISIGQGNIRRALATGSTATECKHLTYRTCNSRATVMSPDECHQCIMIFVISSGTPKATAGETLQPLASQQTSFVSRFLWQAS